MISRRRLLMSSHKIDVLSLTFSYTGSYTDTVSTMGGETYRLLTFTTSGTLTLDEKMVGRVPFDAWVIGEGGDGGTGASSSSYSSGGSFYELGGTHAYHSSSVGCLVKNAHADGGGEGGNSEWKQIYAYQPTVNTIVIDSGTDGNSISVGGTSIITAEAGNNASGTTDAVDKTRYGTAWFTLPTAYNGNGGAAGIDDIDYWCVTHDIGGIGANGSNGGVGVSGIVYIRIPIDY